MKRKILFVILLCLIAFGAMRYFTLSDLRSRYLLPEDDPERVAALLSSMAIAHGTHQWDSLATYQVSFSEAFYGFIGQMGNPFSEDQTRFSLKFLPGTHTGQLAFTSGEDQGTIWGIQEGQTYTLDQNKNLIIDENPLIYFWLPTYQYFIEFPWRIQEATSFRYMGRHEINGQACEGILASWDTVEPQRDVDQYIVWISKMNSRIVKIEYTIRDMYPFLTGAASFEQYREMDGFLLPTAFPVESNLVADGLLHTMKILDFQSDAFKPGNLEMF